MTENSGVLDTGRSTAGSGKERRLFSLVEVAQTTGIPMPILLRYKREHPERVPSVGSGSQQRFPEEAFEALRQIQKEESEGPELPRRGGFGLLSLPRLRRRTHPADDEEAVHAEATVSAAEAEGAQADEAKPAPAPEAPRPRPAAAKAAPPAGKGELLSLVEISNRVDIPYPTLARYASQYGDRIPHQGKGRSRRFPPEAIEVFEQIRKESKPGRPPKAKSQKAAAQAPARRSTAAPAPKAAPTAAEAAPRAAGDDPQLARRIASLESSQKLLEEQIRELISALSKPATVTVNQV